MVDNVRNAAGSGDLLEEIRKRLEPHLPATKWFEQDIVYLLRVIEEYEAEMRDSYWSENVIARVRKRAEGE